MSTLHYEIVSPERLLADAEAAMVVVPGTDGDFAVLADHAPFMSTMRPGVIAIHGDSDSTANERLFVKGGLAQVSPSGLTILAEEAMALDSVDADDLAQNIANALEDLARASDDIEAGRIEAELEWMVALQDVV